MTSILKPAAHTLWQSFVATLALWFAGAGVTGWHAVHSFSDLQRFAISGAVAVLAAAASALFHTLRIYGPRLVQLEFRDDPVKVALVDAALDQVEKLKPTLDSEIAKLFPVRPAIATYAVGGAVQVAPPLPPAPQPAAEQPEA